MRQIFAISTILFLNINILYSQDIQKEKVYLLFKKNDGNYYKSLGKKFIKGNSINFNLYKYYFTHEKNMQKDTLCLWHLKDYKITKESELKALEKKWRIDNEEALKKKHVLYKQLNRNGVFDINIIEIINDTQMVIYNVIFRNEGVID